MSRIHSKRVKPGNRDKQYKKILWYLIMCTTLCVTKALYDTSIIRYYVVEWDNSRLLPCLRFACQQSKMRNRGHPTMIYVSGRVKLLRIPVLHCQTATDFFSKTSAKWLENRVISLVGFRNGYISYIFAGVSDDHKLFGRKLLEGNVQLAVSEMEMDTSFFS